MASGGGADPRDVAIHVEGLSKSYRLGQRRAYYKTLRESLMRMAKRPSTSGAHPPSRRVFSGLFGTFLSTFAGEKSSGSSGETAPARARS